MPTLLGLITSDEAGVVVNRACGSGYCITCTESKMSTDLGSTWHAGVVGRHYLFFSDAWPPNFSDSTAKGKVNVDWTNGSISRVSFKLSSGVTWAQGAAGVDDAHITSRANELVTWQDARVSKGRNGANTIFIFHHEPNNDSGPGMSIADYWVCYEHIIDDIFRPAGVRIWTGTTEGTTITEGLILSIAMVSGTQVSGIGHSQDIYTWWGPSTANAATNPGLIPWADDNIVLHGADAYNQADVFKTFAFTHSTFKAWSDAKKIWQNAHGKPFFPFIGETGCHEASDYTSDSAAWIATGLTRSKVNWYINAAQFIKTWPDLYACIFFDASGDAGLWQIDSTQAAWDQFRRSFCQDSYFLGAAPVRPASVGAAARGRYD